MQTKFNLPQYKVVYYQMKPQTGYYTKTDIQPDKTPVMRLPYELRVTPAQVEKIKCNARELIVSRERFKTGSYKFITGIQPTDFETWYSGNDFEKLNGLKVNSIILFHFSHNSPQFTCIEKRVCLSCNNLLHPDQNLNSKYCSAKFVGEATAHQCRNINSNPGNWLTVYYFGRFYIDYREARTRFINTMIPSLLRQNTI